MSLGVTIDKDLAQGLRERDAIRVSVLRLLKSAVKNAAIAKRVKEGDMKDEDIMLVLRQEMKKRTEAMDAYRSGGRPELAHKEEREREVLAAYMPPSLSSLELARIIREVIEEQQIGAPFSIGKLMGPVMQKVAGRADGAAVRAEVQKFIESS